MASEWLEFYESFVYDFVHIDKIEILEIIF